MAALLWRSPTSGPWEGQRWMGQEPQRHTYRRLRLVFARQLLQVRNLVVRRHVRISHGEVLRVGVGLAVGVVVGAAVLVMAGKLVLVVVVVEARGSEDRGAHR
jgi:hypothetical protein